MDFTNPVSRGLQTGCVRWIPASDIVIVTESAVEKYQIPVLKTWRRKNTSSPVEKYLAKIPDWFPSGIKNPALAEALRGIRAGLIESDRTWKETAGSLVGKLGALPCASQFQCGIPAVSRWREPCHQ